MLNEENYMTYVEDEGCCDAVIVKLRKKRHFVVITLLLILAIVSILAGLLNGVILKKYSDLALIMGIFFPSILLVFICVYLAFICGRESFRSSMMSRIHHLSGRRRSHLNQDLQPYSQTESAPRSNLRVRYQPKAGIESIDYTLEDKNEKQSCDKIGYSTGEIVDYCESKIARKHVRSFSSSDISKRMSDNHLKKSEVSQFTSRDPGDDPEGSPRFRKHQDVKQRKEFKRSVSDTANRNRYTKSREDRYVWNTRSLDKLKKNVVKVSSLNDAIGKRDFEPNEAVRKPPETFPRQKNRKSTEKCDKSLRFKEHDDCDQRYKTKQQQYVNMGHEKNIRKENCYTKSEIRLYSSSVLNPSYEYKQTLRFSSFQPGRKAVKDFGEMASCSSGDEKSSSFSRSDCDTLEMEKKTNRFENFPSERDTYRSRRKTVYFPSTHNKESTRPSGKYAHEYSRCIKKENKMTRQLFPKDEEKLEHQRDKQIKFLTVNEWIQNNEEIP